MSETKPPVALKITVISMGIMIIGGFLWVGAVVIHRIVNSSDSPKIAAQSQPLSTNQTSLSQCASFEISRSSRGDAPLALQRQADGNWLASYGRGDRQSWKLFSPCGKQIQTIELAPKTSAR